MKLIRNINTWISTRYRHLDITELVWASGYLDKNFNHPLPQQTTKNKQDGCTEYEISREFKIQKHYPSDFCMELNF